MKPMHLINSRCHYCSWCELLPPRFAVDQGYTAILVCSPIHSSSSLGGRKIDGNINGNMNESNLQAPAASFWCMYTLKKGGTWSYRGQERNMSLFPEGRISCCAFGYQAEAVLSDLCVTCTNVFQSPFISRTKNISNYGKNKIAIPSLGNKWN